MPKLIIAETCPAPECNLSAYEVEKAETTGVDPSRVQVSDSFRETFTCTGLRHNPQIQLRLLPIPFCAA